MCMILWVKFHMETIQVVLGAKLLKATDCAAKRERMNRSALIRRALEEHLKRLERTKLEEIDRRGYLANPQSIDEYVGWEKISAWPSD